MAEACTAGEPETGGATSTSSSTATAVSSTTPLGSPADWFAPVLGDGSATLTDLCERGVCVSETIVLPQARLIETAIDLPMPATLGAVSIERIWTGERSGLFGPGWESIWDLRVSGGRLSGPVPAVPLALPSPGATVALADGTGLTFDSNGRLVGVCSPGAYCVSATWADRALSLTSVAESARAVILELNADGHVTSAHSDDGRSLSYTYSPDGSLASATTASGTGTTEVSYAYDLEGHLTGISAPDGNRGIGYGTDGTVTAITGRDGSVTTIGTITEDELASQVERTVRFGDGTERSYTFEGGWLVNARQIELGELIDRTVVDDRIVRESRPLDGVVATVGADGVLRVTPIDDQSATAPIEYTLDDRGRIVSTRSSGRETTMTYDDSGRRTEVSEGEMRTSYTYDDEGLLDSVTDADGYSVAIERDADGNITKLSDGVTETQFEHDAAGNPVVQRTGESVASASYDALGRLASATTPSESATYTYDDAGRLAGVESADGDDSEFAYDTLGVVSPAESSSAELEELAALGLMSVDSSGQPDGPTLASAVVDLNDGSVRHEFAGLGSVTYDALGRATAVETPQGTTARTFDAMGRLSTLSMPDGRHFALGYTPAGRLETVNATGTVITASWHGDLLTEVDVAGGGHYEYEYDTAGRVIEASQGAQRWRYAYTPSGEIAGVDGPVGISSAIWRNGLPVALTDSSGNRTDVAWDGDRLLSASTSGAPLYALEWANEQLTRFASVDGELAFAYHADGRLASYTTSGSDPIEVGYDTGTRLIEALTVGGETERWQRSESGEVTSVAVTADDEPADEYALSWTAPGVLSGVARNGEELAAASTPSGILPSEVRKGDEIVLTATYDGGRIETATLGDAKVSIERDAELRVTAVNSDDLDLEFNYERGAVVAVRDGDVAVNYSYEDGRLAGSSYRDGEGGGDPVNLRWSEGRPVAFTGSPGNGSFAYGTDGRVTRIGYDDRDRVVEYDDEGRPHADGTGQEFLSDLFDERGRFLSTPASAADEPMSPLVDSLPAEIGLLSPGVTSGTDVLDAAVTAAIPELPVPFVLGAPGEEFSTRITNLALSMSATEVLEFTPARTSPIVVMPRAEDLARGLVSTPTSRVALSAEARLAGDPCLACRLVDGVGSVARGVVAGAGAVVGFIARNPIASAILFSAFTLLLSVPAGLPLGVILAVGNVALEVGLAWVEGASPLGAVYAGTVGPVVETARGVRRGDLGAVAAVVLAVGQRLSVWGRLASKVSEASCGLKRVVCMSVASFGQAAEHALESQRWWGGQLLRINRSDTVARRQSALRGFERITGLDRDEWPAAVLRAANEEASVRYIDPTMNRALGAWLGNALAPLPDGARVLVRGVA